MGESMGFYGKGFRPIWARAAGFVRAAFWVGLVAFAPLARASEVEKIFDAVLTVRAEIPEDARTARSLGLRREGTGVVIGENGLVLTIGYLVLEAHRIQVVTRDGTVLPASMVGYDANSGFGVVRAIGPLKARPVPIGKSANLKKDDPVLIVSASGGGGVNSAMVASRRTFAGYWEYLLEEAIFTVPAVPNYAGAALFDTELRLVGVGSLFVADAVTKGTNFPGNMFVPTDRLEPELSALVATGRPRAAPKPWLGLYAREMMGRVIVNRVALEGPAHQAGLERGDIILTVAGREITTLEELFRALWSTGEAGVSVPLTLLHGSRVREMAIKSRDRYTHYKFLKIQ